MRPESNSPSPAQRQVQAGAPESKFLSVVLNTATDRRTWRGAGHESRTSRQTHRSVELFWPVGALQRRAEVARAATQQDTFCRQCIQESHWKARCRTGHSVG